MEANFIPSNTFGPASYFPGSSGLKIISAARGIANCPTCSSSSGLLWCRVFVASAAELFESALVLTGDATMAESILLQSIDLCAKSAIAPSFQSARRTVLKLSVEAARCSPVQTWGPLARWLSRMTWDQRSVYILRVLFRLPMLEVLLATGQTLHQGLQSLSGAFEQLSLAGDKLGSKLDGELPKDQTKWVIFVVDDERVIANTLATILRQHGYVAHPFYGAADVLRAAANSAPHILLSDVMMPGMNGVELARSLTSICPQCRVLLFSGQAATADLLAGSREFDILQKPIHPSDLLHRLRLEQEAVRTQHNQGGNQL